VRKLSDLTCLLGPGDVEEAAAHPLADSWIRLESARLMAIHAAKLYDDHQNCGI
jgi:alkylation response protein AidB-like acyl-CoA dehydrogenase